ncbi:MAG: ATP-binding protein [Kofleriaceae bacterium]|nr:ATP-binding protein [Kofleriaceae bacterium]
MRFETKLKLGYALLVAVLSITMAFTIHRLSSVADEQVEWLRAEERAATLAERLRWNSEFVVSTGRAYLLSGDPDLYREVENARARFDDRADLLRQEALGSTARQLFKEVEDAADSFLEVQGQLVAARRDGADEGGLARRFDAELFPRSVTLDRALRRLVDYKEARIAELYGRASADRARLAGGLYALLGMVMFAGAGIAWVFARLLGRSYRQEQDALRTARDAVAARDEIMGIVAHDLRSPLGAITMRATMLHRQADSDDTRRQAASIENVAMRMEYLIKSMMDVVTMEAGRFSLIRTSLSVDDLVREAVELFAPLAAAKQVHIEALIKDPGLETHADRERMLQVLANLIGNALKFTPQGGHVIASVERQGDQLRIGIFDTGPGISSQHLAHIFDRFWKHDTPGVKGTGLGLFIAKNIVEAHGGRIWAESEPGQGARFYFTLALTPGPSVPAARAMPPQSPGGE